MMERDAGILADDMGLGKTFQIIGLLKNDPLRTLIICPPALVYTWSEELKACGLPDVTVITYNKACLYTKDIASEKFPRIVLDEGHAIRNRNVRWNSCITIAAASEKRWILSATPIQNGSSDWRNLCAWLRVDTTDKSIMLRRTMESLRDSIPLPPPPRFISHSLSIPAETPEGNLFHTLTNQLENAVEKEVSAFLKLELWMRIQQFTVHPQIYIEAMRVKNPLYCRPDWTGTATKWSACMYELSVAVEEAVPTIVFCNFRREMDMVALAATRMGAEVCSIRGGALFGPEVARAKEAAVAGKPVVVIVQIVCGGAGLNLQFCRRILFLSQHWNPAVVHQAIGRAVRIRQEAVVEIHMFSIADDVMDNVDRRMRELHGVKIAAAKEVCTSFFNGFPHEQ
jgi:SNF2 family DNA or RNA helicase